MPENIRVLRESARNRITHNVTLPLGFVGEWGIFAMWRVTGTLMLAGALLLGGCNSAPEASPEPVVDAAAEQAAALLQAQKSCITTTLNETAFNAQATVGMYLQRDLTGCPDDFISAFVDFRNAVRSLAETTQEVAAHGQQGNGAALFDAGNLVCSIWQGEQCARSATVDWAFDQAALKEQFDAKLAAVRDAWTRVESVSGRYGVYARQPDPASPSQDSMENAM